MNMKIKNGEITDQRKEKLPMKLMKKILAAMLAASMLVSGMTVCVNAASAPPAVSISVRMGI